MNQTTPDRSPEPRLWGLVAEYGDTAALPAAAARVRQAEFTRWDCCTPFPIHGLDRAMGIRPTRLPWIVLAGGLAGCAIVAGHAVVLQLPADSPGRVGRTRRLPL